MTLIYHQFMTPMWLKEHAKFMVNYACNDVVLDVTQDTRMHETILELPIISPGRLARSDQLLVKIDAGLEYSDIRWQPSLERDKDIQRQKDADLFQKINDLIAEVKAIKQDIKTLNDRLNSLSNEVSQLRTECRTKIANLQSQINSLQSQINSLRRAMWWRRDPMSIMISDTESAMGFETRDPSDYNTLGPYRGVEGRYTQRGLHEPLFHPRNEANTSLPALEPVQKPRWPQLFRIILVIEPAAFWGRCYSDIDGGHSISIEYNLRSFDLTKGLKFVLFRGEFNELYHINYFDVAVETQT